MFRLCTDTVTLQPSEDERVESSGLRKVPGCPQLQWSFETVQRSNGDHMAAYIRVVGGPATASGTIVVFDGYKAKGGSYMPETKHFKFNFVKGEKHGFGKIINSVGSHMWYKITCNISIMPGGETTVAPTMIHEFIELNPSDAVIRVGEREIKVDRGLLAMLSPDFRAMLNADPKSNTITIDDFDFNVVERVINNCCGRTVAFNTLESILEMIRFCEKYNIKPPIAKLQVWLETNVKLENFVQLADYAWKHSIPSLQNKCVKVFYKHVEKLSRNPEFLQFDPTLVADIFKAAANVGKSCGGRLMSSDIKDWVD